MSEIIMKILLLIILLFIIIFIIKTSKKIINIIIIILLLAFSWYSFFTDTGAARLSILLTGKPVVAYTTHLEKQEAISNDRVTYFKSSKPIKSKYAKCNKLWIIRVPVVE